MPSWYPYIDWDKSDMEVTVLKPDTPQEIKDDFAKYLEELKKPKKGFVDKQLCFLDHSKRGVFYYARSDTMDYWFTRGEDRSEQIKKHIKEVAQSIIDHADDIVGSI